MLHDAQLGAGGQCEPEYRVPKGLNLRDEIGRYWRIAQAHWADFKSGRDAKADSRLVSERFVLAVLRDAFGFASLALAFGLGMAEWARGLLFTGFPWNDLGMALGVNLVDNGSILDLAGNPLAQPGGALPIDTFTVGSSPTYAAALDLCRRHADSIEAVAEGLAERETLSGERAVALRRHAFL